jgi:serine/threonine protein kinase
LSQEGYSDKIDSWSLGILTYELLYGKSPFESDIIKISMNKDQKAELSELSFPECIPIEKKTRDFIENLLSENPDLRMDMDGVLRHPFLRQDFSI